MTPAEVGIIRQFRRRKAQCGAGVAFHPLVERGGERDAHSPRHRRSALSSGGGLSGRCAPLTARYLPVGSGYSTLIKVSSIRSDGIGNRSITRACIVHPLGSPAPSSNASKHPFLIDIPPILLLPSGRIPSIESVCRVRRQRPFSSPRRGSVASCSPLFPTNDSALSGIPKGMTRVRVVIRRLAKKEEPLAFADSLGTEERSNPSFAHRGGVVINRRAYGERERKV